MSNKYDSVDDDIKKLQNKFTDKDVKILISAFNSESDKKYYSGFLSGCYFTVIAMAGFVAYFYYNKKR